MTLPAGWKPGADARQYDAQTGTEDSSSEAIEEQIIWKNEVMKGIIRKEVGETQILTNLRVIRNGQAFNLHSLDDVVVMNKHSIRKGTYVSTGRYTRIGTGTSTGKSIGDVVFIYQGKPVITFYQIGDPAGLAKLAKTARKSILDRLKMEEKAKIAADRAAAKPKPKKAPTSGSSLACSQCSNENPADAKFCNGCGKALSSTCPKCQKVNAQGASFCAECGLPLS
jgi:hypothetical protein